MSALFFSFARLWRAPAEAAIALGILFLVSAAGGAEAGLNTVRVFATEPACFEYLFTGVVSEVDGQPLLAFNHRSGRTFFARPGEILGCFRVAAFESKTNRVYNPSLNAVLDEPAGKVTLTGPAGAAVILEQNRRLPRPGRIAWLVQLDNGAWWNIQEQDVFVMDNRLVAVEEIDEDGVMVTSGQDLACIRRISSDETNALNRLWAEHKREEQKAQELARVRQREAAKPQAATADAGASYFTYDRGPRVEIRGPSRFFYGCEYRFPAAFQAYASAQYVNGRLIPSYVVLPARFETRYTGFLMNGP